MSDASKFHPRKGASMRGHAWDVRLNEQLKQKKKGAPARRNECPLCGMPDGLPHLDDCMMR